MKGEKSGQKYKCHLCSVETFKQICLTNHLTEIHKENIKCDECKTKFQTILSMKLHFCTATSVSGAAIDDTTVNVNVSDKTLISNIKAERFEDMMES